MLSFQVSPLKQLGASRRCPMGKGAEKKPRRKARTIAPPNFDDYWQHRMDGATSRLKAAQQIVSHPGTRGNLAENLVRLMPKRNEMEIRTHDFDPFDNLLTELA